MRGLATTSSALATGLRTALAFLPCGSPPLPGHVPTPACLIVRLDLLILLLLPLLYWDGRGLAFLGDQDRH